MGHHFASGNGRGEKEREKEREADRNREREADRETDREREREREGDNKDTMHPLQAMGVLATKLMVSNEGPSAMLEKGKSHKVVDSN